MPASVKLPQLHYLLTYYVTHIRSIGIHFCKGGKTNPFNVLLSMIWA